MMIGYFSYIFKSPFLPLICILFCGNLAYSRYVLRLFLICLHHDLCFLQNWFNFNFNDESSGNDGILIRFFQITQLLLLAITRIFFFFVFVMSVIQFHY
jgi:hypothetical protein